MKTHEPYVIERIYNAPAEKVWQAITDKNQMKQWYFDLEEFRPEVGFEFRFNADCDGQDYLHLCRVTEVIPGKKIAYTWRYPDYEGNSEVTWELFPEGEKTRLRLTHTGLESFPQNDPNFTKESFSGGWTHFIGTALPGFLEKPSTTYSHY